MAVLFSAAVRVACFLLLCCHSTHATQDELVKAVNRRELILKHSRVDIIELKFQSSQLFDVTLLDAEWDWPNERYVRRTLPLPSSESETAHLLASLHDAVDAIAATATHVTVDICDGGRHLTVGGNIGQLPTGTLYRDFQPFSRRGMLNGLAFHGERWLSECLPQWRQPVVFRLAEDLAEYIYAESDDLTYHHFVVSPQRGYVIMRHLWTKATTPGNPSPVGPDGPAPTDEALVRDYKVLGTVQVDGDFFPSSATCAASYVDSTTTAAYSYALAQPTSQKFALDVPPAELGENAALVLDGLTGETVHLGSEATIGAHLRRHDNMHDVSNPLGYWLFLVGVLLVLVAVLVMKTRRRPTVTHQ